MAQAVMMNIVAKPMTAAAVRLHDLTETIRCWVEAGSTKDDSRAPFVERRSLIRLHLQGGNQTRSQAGPDQVGRRTCQRRMSARRCRMRYAELCTSRYDRTGPKTRHVALCFRET